MENEIINTDDTIREKILVIRGQQVMIDRDLAQMYGVETKRLNEQVKRNIERFPESFCFQLSDTESESFLRSQIATSKTEMRGGRRYNPYAFTEQGVAMLSSVLKSETAVKVSIQIMNAFVSMRRFLQNNMLLFDEVISIRHHQIEADNRIDELFTLMDKYKIDETQGIFFQGQIFDAYSRPIFDNRQHRFVPRWRVAQRFRQKVLCVRDFGLIADTDDFAECVIFLFNRAIIEIFR